MDLDAAIRVLRLSDHYSETDALAAYRRALHEVHPDRLGEGASTSERREANRRTGEVVDAYEVIRRASAEFREIGSASVDESACAPPAESASAVGSAVGWAIGPDTVALGCPADEAYLRLLAAGHRLGEVSYVDRQNEIFEVIVRTTEGDTLSVVCTLQGRANGTTEAFFTLEPLDRARGPLPEIAAVTELVLELLETGTG